MKKILLAAALLGASIGAHAASITHAATYAVVGTDFGTRTVDAAVYDYSGGADPQTLWDGAGIGNDAFAYSPAFHSVPQSNPFSSRYAIAQVVSANTGNAWLAKDVTFSGTRKVFIQVHRRMDPSWPFGSTCDDGGADDNNFKWLTVSAGGGVFENPYWYFDNGGGQKCALTDDIYTNLFSSGNLGTMSHVVNLYPSRAWGGSGNQAQDPWYSWVNMEWRFVLASSGASFKFLANNELLHHHTGLNSDDAAGTTRSIAIGVDSRVRDNANHYGYLDNINLVAGPDAWKRVVLANHATYTSATVTENQIINSWADTSISITVIQGNIPSGTAWLHVFDADDNVIHTEQVTVGATSTIFVPIRTSSNIVDLQRHARLTADRRRKPEPALRELPLAA